VAGFVVAMVQEGRKEFKTGGRLFKGEADPGARREHEGKILKKETVNRFRSGKVCRSARKSFERQHRAPKRAKKKPQEGPGNKEITAGRKKTTAWKPHDVRR